MAVFIDSSGNAGVKNHENKNAKDKYVTEQTHYHINDVVRESYEI